MKSLLQLWLSAEHRPIRVRHKTWGMEVHYFEMIGVDNKSMCFYGLLDSGEEVAFPVHSDNWEYFSPDRFKPLKKENFRETPTAS